MESERTGPARLGARATEGLGVSERRWALRLDRRAWTINEERKLSPVERSRLERLARANQIPLLQAIELEVHPHVPSGRHRPDVAAHAPAAKAAVDGLVDAGVLTNDGPSYVRAITFRPPIVDGTEALVLV